MTSKAVTSNTFTPPTSGGDMQNSPSTAGKSTSHGLDRLTMGGGENASTPPMQSTAGKAGSHGFHAVTGGGSLPNAEGFDKVSVGGKATGFDVGHGGISSAGKNSDGELRSVHGLKPGSA